MLRAALAMLTLLLAALAGGAEETLPGGFSAAGAIVPREHLVAGGPPRDGIKSVDAPRFVPRAEASWVAPPNPVLGVHHGGEARAYPVHVIERHQVVNDTIGGVPVVVTYDPLTAAPRAWERSLGGRVLSFGVAGLLYNSNFLMYDRDTETLWSQMTGKALAGEQTGSALRPVEVRQETLAMWTERHGDTLVLAPPSEAIDYRHSPFYAYWISEKIPSRVDARDDRFHPKEVALGLEAGGTARAYLGSLVTEAGGTVRDTLAGHAVEIEYFTDDAIFRWKTPPEVRVTESYWFAWKAFHPNTEVWNDPAQTESDAPK